jgi:uncharacterized protein (DUF1778 family)
VTTVLIDDELGRQVGRAAAAQGKTLDEFVHDVLRQAVEPVVISRTVRNGLPVLHRGPAIQIDPEVVQRTLEEQGF